MTERENAMWCYKKPLSNSNGSVFGDERHSSPVILPQKQRGRRGLDKLLIYHHPVRNLKKYLPEPRESNSFWCLVFRQASRKTICLSPIYYPVEWAEKGRRNGSTEESKQINSVGVLICEKYSYSFFEKRSQVNPFFLKNRTLYYRLENFFFIFQTSEMHSEY